MKPSMICLLLACTPLTAQTTQKSQDQRPNIVFIFSDDHAVQAISAYGSGLNKTPNIDRIAQEGVLFTQSFCGNSICAPSRATVLTGKHTHKNGQRDNRTVFDGKQVTFPKLLHAAGYQTALIGKWHLKSDPTGFDHWDILKGQGNYYNPVFRTSEGRKRIEGYATDIITDKSLAWLDKRDPKKPFLLMCQHKAPHRTWAPAPRHLHLYDDVTFPEPPTLFDNWEHRSRLLAKNEMSIRDYFYWDYDLKVRNSGLPNPFGRNYKSPEYRRMTKAQRKLWDAAYMPKNKLFLEHLPEGKEMVRWKYQRYIKDYLRTIQAVDESVGRILDYLDKKGLTDNTIVVYSSDQGFYLGEHGWFDKRWIFEESLRMPLLMRWPGHIQKGSKIDFLVQNIDYAPTFLQAAQVRVPKEMQGESMLPMFQPEPSEQILWRKAIYYCYYEVGEHNVPRHEGVRNSRYKLFFIPKTQEWQLFDLVKDPHELVSVHADPAYAGILKQMRQTLLDLRKKYDAHPWPLPKD